MQTLKSFLIRVDVLLFLVCFALFVLFPQIDLITSKQFFDVATQHFIYKHNEILHVIYVIFAKLPILLLLILPVMIAVFCRRYSWEHTKKSAYIFLLLSLLLGPGLLVNTVIKNHSIGRARPSQIENFGGQLQFTSAFEESGQCRTNCSFVSGHAAMGFYFIALGWLLASRRAFYFGLFVGALVGMTRIMQGGHFLSDVIFAFWAVYLVNILLAQFFKLQHPLIKSQTEGGVGTDKYPVITVLKPQKSSS